MDEQEAKHTPGPKMVHYTVRGFWPFPLDMLHHDQSRPASAADQGLIDRLSGDHAPDLAAFRPVDINLVGLNRPNTARWESFSWAVPTDHEHTFFRELKRREAERQRVLEGALAKLTPEEREAVRAAIEKATNNG